jgi:UMF1 family MFS transporter
MKIVIPGRRVVDALVSQRLTLSGAVPASRLGQISWALYEWARNPYYILVIIYIFGPYFINVVVGDPVRGQIIWGYASSLVGALLAVAGPVLGAIADAGGRRKPWLFGCTFLAVPAMASLWFARPGMGENILTVVASLIAASILFECSVIFHNSMLPSLASRGRVGGLSGLGLALGNASGVLLFLFVLSAWIWPEHPAFGLDAKTYEPERAIGLLTGLWFGVFSLPLFLFTPDNPGTGRRLGPAIRQGVFTLIHTLMALRRYRNVAQFVVARMIFADGFGITLTFTGIYAAGIFGWGSSMLSIYGITLSVVAAFASVLAGRIDDRLGSRRTLLIALGLGIAVNIVNVSLSATSILFVTVPGAKLLWNLSLPELVFFLNSFLGCYAIVAGLVSSRTLMARLAPPSMAGEFFGLFAFAGTATAFLGPLSVATMTRLFQSQRAGLSVVILFLAVGAILLYPVREEQTVA